LTARRVSHAGRGEARAALCARFVVDEARCHGVSLGFYNGRIYAWAPTAASPELQLQCERSFTRAVRQNLNAITALADQRSSLRARLPTRGT
jgi:hypothetical protein